MKPFPPTHGGARPNAGRKPAPTGKKLRSGAFSLSPGVHAFVTALPANTRSAFVEAAIRAQMPK